MTGLAGPRGYDRHDVASTPALPKLGSKQTRQHRTTRRVVAPAARDRASGSALFGIYSLVVAL